MKDVLIILYILFGACFALTVFVLTVVLWDLGISGLVDRLLG